MGYSLIASETVFEGKVFKVRVDRVRRPSGQTMRVDTVEHGGAVTLVPVDGSGHVWFVRQYRHPPAEVLLELPAGTLERGEDPKASAIRECQEEIGMKAGHLEELGEFFLAPGYSTEFMVVYLAEDLSPSPLAPDEDEDLLVERVPLTEVPVLIADGAIRDAKSLAGLLLLQIRRPDLLSLNQP